MLKTFFYSRSCHVLQVDKADDPETVKIEAEEKGAICLSAIYGDGLEQFCFAVQAKLKVRCSSKCIFLLGLHIIHFLEHYIFFFIFFVKAAYSVYWFQDAMVPVEACIPYDKGELLNTIHQVGMVEATVSMRSKYFTFNFEMQT